MRQTSRSLLELPPVGEPLMSPMDGWVRRVPQVMLSLLVVATLVLTTLVLAPRTEAQRSNVILGASPNVSRGGSLIQATDRLENVAGRRLGMLRIYLRWDDNVPLDQLSVLRDRGYILHISIRSIRRDGSGVAWSEVANAPAGTPVGDRRNAVVRAIRSLGGNVIFTFHHEPEARASSGLGSNDDFIAAWRRVIGEFRNQGVGNIRFAWTMTSFAFSTDDRRNAALWYPGGDWVDLIGANVINGAQCSELYPGRDASFNNLMSGVLRAGSDLGKPIIIPELGTVERPGQPGGKAQWIADAAATLKTPAYSQVEAVEYFNQPDPVTPQCRFGLETSPEAAQAFRNLARDAFFGGAATQPAPTPAAPTTTQPPAPTTTSPPQPEQSVTPEPPAPAPEQPAAEQPAPEQPSTPQAPASEQPVPEAPPAPEPTPVPAVEPEAAPAPATADEHPSPTPRPRFCGVTKIANNEFIVTWDQQPAAAHYVIERDGFWLTRAASNALSFHDRSAEAARPHWQVHVLTADGTRSHRTACANQNF